MNEELRMKSEELNVDSAYNLAGVRATKKQKAHTL